ncbi:MAG: PEGA domain-containing protein [Patescibacteria group bacterium]
MRKLFFIIIPSLILASLIFFVLQYVYKGQGQKGALQVTSSPESKVYLDDTYIGQTPLCECDATDMLQAGDYTIRLEPLDKKMQEFQEKITIASGVLTVVDRKFGEDSLSEGSVISLTALSDKTKAELLVVSFPRGSMVLLDNSSIGDTPVLHKDPTESDHVLKVKKDGYKEKTIRIRTPLGYKLTVAAYLSTSLEAPQEASRSASPSATLSPSPAVAVTKILILDTPTGFLRVRAESSVGASEIGQVTPGESYDLVEEKAGWFKITLPDGVEGWISSQYAKKAEE